MILDDLLFNGLQIVGSSGYHLRIDFENLEPTSDVTRLIIDIHKGNSASELNILTVKDRKQLKDNKEKILGYITAVLEQKTSISGQTKPNENDVEYFSKKICYSYFYGFIYESVNAKICTHYPDPQTFCSKSRRATNRIDGVDRIKNPEFENVDSEEIDDSIWENLKAQPDYEAKLENAIALKLIAT